MEVYLQTDANENQIGCHAPDAAGTLTFPASVMLVAAMNPCPCGFFGDPTHECSCSPVVIQRYRSRISGPLLDRIDIHIEVPAVRYKELTEKSEGESSEQIRERVDLARAIQLKRFAGMNFFSNAQMGSRELRTHCQIEAAGERLLELAINRLGLSARAYTRILKVARTVADLDASERIEANHICRKFSGPAWSNDCKPRFAGSGRPLARIGEGLRPGVHELHQIVTAVRVRHVEHQGLWREIEPP